MAVRILDGAAPDIWILEIERDMLMRLTFDDAVDVDPVWRPDGEWIAFASDREGSVRSLFRRRADGTGQVERLTTSERSQVPMAFSPDGSLLVFQEEGETTAADIMVLHMDDDECETEALWATPFEEFHPSVSPDGKWLAYTSNESGRYEVYVQPFPGGGRRVKISAELGFLPKWSPDGSDVFYRSGSGTKLMVVPVSVAEDTFQAKTPRVLFELKRGGYAFWYDVAPDGQRFVFGGQPGEDDEQFRQPTIVVNWFEELRAKVPVGR